MAHAKDTHRSAWRSRRRNPEAPHRPELVTGRGRSPRRHGRADVAASRSLRTSHDGKPLECGRCASMRGSFRRLVSPARAPVHGRASQTATIGATAGKASSRIEESSNFVKLAPGAPLEIALAFAPDARVNVGRLARAQQIAPLEWSAEIVRTRLASTGGLLYPPEPGLAPGAWARLRRIARISRGQSSRFKRRLTVKYLDELVPAGSLPSAELLNAVLDDCGWAHAEWVRIHPFAKGNGRTARVWASLIDMRYGLRPSFV